LNTAPPRAFALLPDKARKPQISYHFLGEKNALAPGLAHGWSEMWAAITVGDPNFELFAL